MSLVDKYLGSYYKREKEKRVIIQAARAWGRTTFAKNILTLKSLWHGQNEKLTRWR